MQKSGHVQVQSVLSFVYENMQNKATGTQTQG